MKRTLLTRAVAAAAFGAALTLAATMGGCAPQDTVDAGDTAPVPVESPAAADGPDVAADPDPAAAEPDPEPVAPKRKTFVGTDTGAGFPEASLLSVEEVAALVEAGEPFTALDIRSLKSYAALHAAGALNIPENQIPFRAEEIPADQPILLIADTANTLEKAHQYLLDAGFADEAIKALDGGMANIWSVPGMQMESGSLEAYAC